MRSLAFGLLVFLFASSAWAYPEYYFLPDRDKAQTEARHRSLPLAWLVGYPDDLTKPSGSYLTRPYVTQQAMNSLDGRSVVIFADVDKLAALPDLIYKQIKTNEQDDPTSHIHYPKLVFTNPEATRAIGRVSCRQLVREGDVEINVALLAISNDPASLARPTAEELAAASAPAGVPGEPAPVPAPSDPDDNYIYLAIGVAAVIMVGVWMRASSRHDPTTFR